MNALITLFQSFLLSADPVRDQAEQFLAQSRDVYDLERRMSQLALGGRTAL